MLRSLSPPQPPQEGLKAEDRGPPHPGFGSQQVHRTWCSFIAVGQEASLSPLPVSSPEATGGQEETYLPPHFSPPIPSAVAVKRRCRISKDGSQPLE